MARARPIALRTLLVAALAAALQGSTCHAHVCSGDGCDDEPVPEDRSAVRFLILDPPARPFGGPILLVPRRP